MPVRDPGTLLENFPDMNTLFLLYMGLDAVDALRGKTAIRRLLLEGNRITDITPLAGLPLEELNLNRNRVTDLEPIRNLPLIQLGIAHNPVASLAPLAESNIGS